MLHFSAVILAWSMTVQPRIDVVYPRIMYDDSTARISQVAENFIFGSVQPPGSQLFINDIPVSPHSNGAFLAFIPVNWESGEYRLTAVFKGDTTRLTVPFGARQEPAIPVAPGLSFPVDLELKGGAARTDPRGAYYIFPSSGTRVKAVNWDDGYYELPLYGSHSVWIADYYVRLIDSLAETDLPVIWKASVLPGDRWEEVVLPIERKTLFRVVDSVEPDQLTVEVFGVISHIDRISFRKGVDLIREVTWDQPADGFLKINILLNAKAWGYRTRWEDGRLIIGIRKPPVFRRGIRGLKIAIDPGHGGDQDGAIGPMRLKEKDVNLKTGLALAELLHKKGAEPFITRISDVAVSLVDRIKFAEDCEADILISLHHNALPDGVNPFDEFGTGVHYYHPQSRDLAESLQGAIIGKLGLFDEGVYYHNLALARPTTMPAVLVESAYIMFPEQEELIRDEVYPELLAEAICIGIRQFVNNRKKLYDR